MKDFIREHIAMIVALVLIVLGFIAFMQSASSGEAEESGGNNYKAINFSSAMTKGDNTAESQMIQYSDFLCPSCSYLSTQIMPSVEKEYIDDGSLAFEFRPMAFIADGSVTAAEGAYCAVDQGVFWPYHDAVYTYVWDNAFSKGIDPTTATILTTDVVKSIASTINLEQEPFDTCLDTHQHANDVAASNQAAQLQGITATPYVLLNGDDVSSSATNITALEALIEAAQ